MVIAYPLLYTLHSLKYTLWLFLVTKVKSLPTRSMARKPRWEKEQTEKVPSSYLTRVSETMRSCGILARLSSSLVIYSTSFL